MQGMDTTKFSNPVHPFMVKIEYEKKPIKPIISFYGSIVSMTIASVVAISQYIENLP